MKVICDRPALVDAVNIVGSVVVARTPAPVLRCIKLTAADGVMTLAATDTEVGLRLTVGQVDVQEDGEAVVPADKLAQIVRASDDPTLTLETDNHTMHIRGQDAHFTVFGFDPGEFPEVRDFGDLETSFEIDAGTLHTVIHRTLFAAASEHSRYAINGVLFERKEKKLRVVATDGRRLAVARGDCKSGSGETNCIVPTKALNLIMKLIDDPDDTVQFAVEPNQIFMRIGDATSGAVLSSNLVEGAFPPFDDVIPKDQDKRVAFDCGALSSAVRRAALLTNEESKGVRLSFADQKLTLTSRAPEMGEAVVEVDMSNYSGDPLEIGFNPAFITDALKVVDSNEVIIELKAPNKPGVLKSGNDFTYVIMPVNLQ